MADEEVLEMDETLETILAYAIDEARQKLVELGSFEPFTIVAEGDNLYVESHPGDIDQVRTNAIDTIKTASSFAQYYAFCYDGYIDTDAGTLDAIIVECAERDQETAFAIAQIYTVEDADDGTLVFEDELAYVGEAEMYFDRATVQHAEEDEFEQAQGNLG